jgi:MoaA/NifB/PqqE/SkfB family radical SAM enzyme
MPTDAQTGTNGITYIDLIDVCNLKCPTCVRGVGVIPNSSKKMPLAKFDSIVAKAKSEGFKWIGLYNWTEPFLNRTLENYVATIKAHGLMCIISTNFSLRRIDNLEAALRAGIDYLIITVSGLDQEVYEINHFNGNIDYVKANTERAAALKRSGAIDTRIILRLLRFEYNLDQADKLHAYADALGIEFEAIVGEGNPRGDDFSHETNEYFKHLLSETRSDRPYDQPGKVCPLMFGQAAIDYSGKAYLCCRYPTHETLEIGDYLSLTAEELLFRKFNHPICASCDLPRRDATPADKQLLFEAMDYRLRSD